MIAKLAGALVGLFYLSGRFSLLGPEHLDSDVAILYEVRFWVLLALIGVTLMSVSRGSARQLKSPRISANRVVALALLLPLYVAVSAFWSIDFYSSLLKATEAAALVAVCVCIIPFLQSGRVTVMRHGFWIAIVTATGLMCLLACFSDNSDRMAVLGGGPNTFGRNMGLLFLGTLYLQRRSPATKAWMWYPPMVMSLLMVVLSGSRGALLAVSVGSFIYFLIDNRYRTRNIVAIGGMGILLLTTVLATEIGNVAFEMFENRILDQTLERQYMSGREDLYAAAFHLGREHPWFGQGLSGFTIIYGINYPHNIVLELFCETGLVGVALLALLLMAALSFVMRYRRHCDPVIWGALGVMLASAMFSGDFFDSRGVFLMALLGSQEIVTLRSAQSWASGVTRISSCSYRPAYPSSW